MTPLPYQIGIKSEQTIIHIKFLSSVNNLLITTALKWITIASDVLVIRQSKSSLQLLLSISLLINHS